jgi:hypothetical protein
MPDPVPTSGWQGRRILVPKDLRRDLEQQGAEVVGEHKVLWGSSAALASVLTDEPVAVSRWRALKPFHQ